VHAIDPDVDVVAVGEAALLEGTVLRLPLVGQPGDVRGGQPGGIIPEQRHQRLAEVAGQTARLLPVAERARALFGKDEGKAAPVRKKREPQMDLFKVLQDADDAQASFRDTEVKSVGNTVLDRVHQSMILFAAGRSEALKRFLVEGGAGRDRRFWKLAQALSALYPGASDEKRWVDGVMARKKALAL
jgi:putative DNA methylase